MIPCASVAFRVTLTMSVGKALMATDTAEAGELTDAVEVALTASSEFMASSDESFIVVMFQRHKQARHEYFQNDQDNVISPVTTPQVYRIKVCKHVGTKCYIEVGLIIAGQKHRREILPPLLYCNMCKSTRALISIRQRKGRRCPACESRHFPQRADGIMELCFGSNQLCTPVYQPCLSKMSTS